VPTFNPNHLWRSVSGYSLRNKPSLFVLGAQKAGTSSLHSYLDQSSYFSGSKPKEVHFFNTDIYFGESLAKYEKRFRGFRDNVTFYESTPAYLYHPETADRIYEYNPSARFIVLLRDPVKRAYSAYNHYRLLFETGEYKRGVGNPNKREGNDLYKYLFEGRQQFPSFREVISIELELIGESNNFEPGILRRGLYLQQLQRFWQCFDQEAFLIIGFKEFISNPTAVLGQIEKHMKQPPHDWSNFSPTVKNNRSYAEPILPDDYKFLEDYYAIPNQALFNVVGHVNW